MGLFDFLKQKRGINEEKFYSKQFQIEAMAFASWKFQENNSDYLKTRNALNELRLSEEQKDVIIAGLKAHNVISTLVPRLQMLINDKQNQKAYDLISDAYGQDKENIQLLEILIQVYQTFNNEDQVLSLFNILIIDNPTERFNIEYRKGLVLKQYKRYNDSIAVFQNLISKREFAWDYYQVAIIENLLGKTESSLKYLAKTFEIDPSLKEDAKEFPELSNLRYNSEFIKLVN